MKNYGEYGRVKIKLGSTNSTSTHMPWIKVWSGSCRREEIADAERFSVYTTHSVQTYRVGVSAEVRVDGDLVWMVINGCSDASNMTAWLDIILDRFRVL